LSLNIRKVDQSIAVPGTSLEQWAVLEAVVDRGGFAAAAAVLHRSQSAVSYTVARLQSALDMPLLAIEGRRAVLTAQGRALLQRARPLLREMESLERLARSLKQGWESALRLVVDAAFPRQRLLDVLAELRQLCPNTEISLSDAVLSGAEQVIAEGGADLVVTSRVPPQFLGEFLMDVIFVAVARPDHALLLLERTLTGDDLTRHVQIVVRDSGSRSPRDEGWLGAERRCTVSSPEASLAMIEAGLGFGWLPEHLIAAPLAAGTLRRLPLQTGASRKLSLQLVLLHPDSAGPALRAAVECFERHRPQAGAAS
jgi:DNA-binding transcriptional LysR family regulator